MYAPNAEFFQIRYAHGAPGCPAFLNGDFNRRELELNPDAPVARDLEIKKKYSFTATNPGLTRLEFDFYGNSTKCVSHNFLDVCQSLQVGSHAIPLRSHL